MKRIYNFNAGPAMLPLEVLQEVQSELLDLQGSGMSILEMSHRAPIYEKINAEAEADIKELLGLGDDYCVLFMGGGASLQFSMVPMNFLGAGQTAAYAVTSNFSDKAVKEAEKVGRSLSLSAVRLKSMTGCRSRARSGCRKTALICISRLIIRSKAQSTAFILKPVLYR